MGIISQFIRDYKKGENNFHYDKMDEDKPSNCIGCWCSTTSVLKYADKVIHYYCHQCQFNNNNDLVNDMFTFFYKMADIRHKRVKEPRVLIVEGNVGIGKTTIIKKWSSEYKFLPAASFVIENVDSWIKYPANKMKLHCKKNNNETEYTNLLKISNGFIRQLYILRQIIEEFSTNISKNKDIKFMVIERGIIGSINIARISPGITSQQMAILQTYVNLFVYDNYQLCVLTDDDNNYDERNIRKDNRILIEEIKNMTAKMIANKEPDFLITKETTFDDINDLYKQKNLTI